MVVDEVLLVTLAERLRVMADGFAEELAVVWPVLAGDIGLPVIASTGDERHVVVDPERVFRYAIRVRATGILLGHNHPVRTGPSRADRAVTRRLIAAGSVLGVPLLAHLVVEPGAVHELVGGRWDLVSVPVAVSLG